MYVIAISSSILLKNTKSKAPIRIYYRGFALLIFGMYKEITPFNAKNNGQKFHSLQLSAQPTTPGHRIS